MLPHGVVPVEKGNLATNFCGAVFTIVTLELPTDAEGMLATNFSGVLFKAQNKVSGICNNILTVDRAPNKVSRIGTNHNLIIETGTMSKQPKRVAWVVVEQKEVKTTTIDPDATTEPTEYVPQKDQGSTDYATSTQFNSNIAVSTPADPNYRLNQANSSRIGATENNYDTVANDSTETNDTTVTNDHTNDESRRAITIQVDLDSVINHSDNSGMGATPNKRATSTQTIDSMQGIINLIFS